MQQIRNGIIHKNVSRMNVVTGLLGIGMLSIILIQGQWLLKRITFLACFKDTVRIVDCTVGLKLYKSL